MTMDRINVGKNPVFLALLLVLMARLPLPTPVLAGEPKGEEHHLLYVAAPGIRNDLEFGGAGLLVFDMDHDHAFVKRIETPASRLEKPENMKGICACAATGKVYFTTPTKLYCLDLLTDT